MLVRSIYYGRLGREATERLLEMFGHDGSFLLRDSETVQGAYCLCVRKAPFVHTYRLVHSTDGWCIQGSGIRQQSFRSLETLIESYRRGTASDVSVPPLTAPLDKTQLQNISLEQVYLILSYLILSYLIHCPLHRFSMSAKDTVRSNKTALVDILCGDRRRILDKVYEKKLITAREYNNLKSINKEDVEGHVVELVDKIMNKGEDHCWDFLNLLQTDEDIKATYPELKNIQLNYTSPLPMPVQACSDDQSPVSKRRKEDEQYQLSSRPTGLCLIINNETFMVSKNRTGTNKDAQSLAEVFSWLGFRVLMCKDQTKDQMGRALKCFASLNDLSQLREFSVQEWTGIRFADLQGAPEHGDAFICCVLSHGEKGVVLGCDGESLSIKEITRTFKATNQSALNGKPKVFLIQACQGGKMQAGVLLSDNLEADGSLSIPEEADVLVAMATVEDHKALRHTIDGSWFVQSVCQQLKEGCPSCSKWGGTGFSSGTICHQTQAAALMEAPPEEESPAGVPGTEGAEQGEQLKASDGAAALISSIGEFICTEPAELQRCVFADSLVTVSEGGRDLGRFTVTVEFACRDQQPCVLLHAQSLGAIDDSPCGTTVTAYLTTDLEVLEEDYHEYVKLEGHSLDKRCHMVQRDGQMVIDKVTTVGEEVVTTESVSYPMSELRGLLTEGSNLLLMRLLALKKKVPGHMTFISFDQGLHIIHTTLSELGLKELEVGGETVEVFGVERVVHSVEEIPTTWQCYFLDDGHLASRVQVGSPVTMRLLQLPSQPQKGNHTHRYKNCFSKETESVMVLCVRMLGFEKIPLVWEEDMQMRSKFLDRKEELKADHASYLRQHPDIRALVADFLQFLLLRKPDDVFQFAREYFLPFASHRPPEPSMNPSL
ncbi:hypothetical protein L3Q82_021759 [Scortum barcoo]|uniref:Uncharacterized protein n=1 Tax=Scortum barcoo TaxID=214431 RepID=A0ACB8X5I9_9TELE|nr:hypothetical protein L3Q82_021759 [Scortum barcoo]